MADPQTLFGGALLGTGYLGDTHSEMHGRVLGLYENPLAYHAIGNGIADDTEPIQTAIDNASTAGGGTVLIPAGYTFLTGTLVPKSGVNIVGEGWTSILRLKDGTNPVGLIHRTYADPPINNVRIANLQIDGNKGNNTTGIGIAFGGSNIVVEGCYIHDTGDGGIALGRPSDGGKIRILNNWVHNPALALNFWGGIAVTGGETAIISGNIVTSNDTHMNYGIDIEPNPGWTVDHALITNNVCVNGSIIVTASGGGLIDTATVTGNMVDADPNAGAGHALKVLGVTGPVVVANNQVRGMIHSSPVLSLEGLSYPQVTGNRLTGMGAQQATYPDNVGILLTDVTGGVVAMNQIIAEANTHATSVAGIRQTGTTSGVTFAFNPMKNVLVPGIASGFDADGGVMDSNDGFSVAGNVAIDGSRNVLANSLRDPNDNSVAALVSDALRMVDAKNIEFATGTGSKLGTTTSQKLAFWGATPIARPTVTGSRGGNAAVANLLTQLAAAGLITDSTTA